MTAWQNWSGSVTAQPRTIARPRDEEELARTVREAAHVRVVGAGHSFMPLCATDDTLVSLSAMDGGLTVAPDRLSVEAPAGWSLARLTEALWAEGLSLANQGDVNPQALCGALATGTHGTGRDLGSLATIGEAFRAIGPDGAVVTCDPATEPDLFEAQRLSLGLLGIVTRARIKVVPAYHLAEKTGPMPLAAVLERLDDLAAATRHMEFFFFPYADDVILKTLDPCEPCPYDGEEESETGFKAACEAARQDPQAVPMIQRAIMERVKPAERRGPAWQIFPADRTTRFEEMEYEVPRAHAVAALKAVTQRLRDKQMPLMFPFEFRLVAGDDIWLSPFHAGPCASISIHQYAGMDWQAEFADLEAVLRDHGGRPHWAKRHRLSSDDVLALYPRAADFGRVRKRFDPEAKFMNAHLAQLFAFSL